MSKVYSLDVRYYIYANNDEELEQILDDMGISSNEYYGGHDVVEVEDVEE